MKLFIVLSLIACGYAAKLDRTYLPPSNAATAGGSPGSLNAPVGPSGSSGFGQPATSSGFGQPAVSSGFGQPAASSGFGQPAANTGFGQPAAFGPSSGPSFGKSTSGPAFGSQPSGLAPSTQYGQPGSSPDIDPGFGQVAQNFGPSAQDYQRNQPQRAQAAAEQTAEILRLDNQNDGETFSYSFETSNGIAAEESGVATNGVQAQGAFSYSDDDGQNFRVTYTADENGYQPQGDHLPTPHPIPEDILKSIEKNAQAAASGTQEGAYNPDEDNSGSAAQQYNYNAPNTYNQGPSASGSLNQQGSGPSQSYGSPNSDVSRPQSGAQGFQPQGPSQQYGAPSTAGSGRPNGFEQSQQAPSQIYGSLPDAATGASQARPNQYQAPQSGFPSAGRPQGSSQAGQAQGDSGYQYDRPNTFGQNQYQSQGPSQQSRGPSRPVATGGSNGFGPSANGFAPSGPASQSKPNQYQAPQSSFPSAGRPQGSSVGRPQGPSVGRPQGSAQAGQAQDDSGYQYDRPQGSFGQPSNGRPSNQGLAANQGPDGGQGPAGSQGSAGQYRPQNEGAGPSASRGSFLRPNSGNAGYPSGPAQKSFGPSSGPSFQGSFGSASGSNTGTLGPKSPSSFGPSSGSAGQSSFGPSAGSAGQGSFGPSAQGPSSFGPSGSSGQASFGPSGSKGPSSFGPSSGSNGFGRPQGSFAGTMGAMADSGYTYDRPGSQIGAGPGARGSQPQSGSNAPGSSDFSGPRQPPSFSEEEGYKY